MDISNFTKEINKYVKPEEVKKNPDSWFVITIEPTLVESDFKGQKNQKVHCEGEWNKEQRSIDLSKTNARVVEKVLTSDTKKWIGHQLQFEVYKTKTSDGKLVDAINIKEVK